MHSYICFPKGNPKSTYPVKIISKTGLCSQKDHFEMSPNSVPIIIYTDEAICFQHKRLKIDYVNYICKILARVLRGPLC